MKTDGPKAPTYKIETLCPIGQKIGGRILADVFMDDPMIQHLFGEESRKPEAKYFYDFMIYESIKLHRHMLCIKEGQRFAGLAIVDTPRTVKGLFVLTNIFYLLRVLVFRMKMPKGSVDFIRRYYKVTTKNRPKKPHYYLNCIGVDPAFQKKGYAKVLMNNIHAMVDQDPRVAGIGLDTENPVNVDIYQKFGYKLVKKEEVEGVLIYSMFREKEGRNA